MPHEYTKRKETQKYIRKNYYHRIKCTAATFLTAFMWRRPLNSVALSITTHRKPKRVFNGTGTQVRARMINMCRMKMVQRRIYNVKDSSWRRDRKKEERKDRSNLNYLCIQLWLIYRMRTSSDWKYIKIKSLVCVLQSFKLNLSVVQFIRA